MPGDAGDKTEAPTARRRQEAREHGQIARSADLTSSLLILGGMLCMRWFGPRMMNSLMTVMHENLTFSDPAAGMRIDVVPTLASLAMLTISAIGPILLGLVVLALASNFAQIGFLLTGHPLSPSLNKLNPINGFARLFSMRTLVQLGMNLAKLALVSLVGWSAIRGRAEQIMLAMETHGWEQVVLLSTVLFDVGLRVGLALLLIALVDYVWQRLRHEKDLRMTKEEVKEEMRRMEGDPVIKQRRRRMQLAAALQHIRKTVPTADVVVTNPTELAIAIKYDAAKMSAPKVVAKGRDYLAAKIREIAIAHRIPIVERKPLAQSLYKMVEVGQEVPEQFYQAIAEILAYVYELSGAVPRRGAA